ncbi:MAG: 2-C-methyl-D-erythritol 2,4-cyclodiphosphate synthase [Clostridia bacterium]|nr:2-C-methyl-D-erythritol 2,4-cyclodiphosphate synthase [Clostridia bacterium]
MYRIGTGYDVHRLVEDRKLILGGVDIPYEKGLLGHSDADVLLHAISDAMLGALALGDIGKHFPDFDPKYKGISSIKLLKEVNNLISPYKVSNIDATVVAEAPKLSPYIEKMREQIADALSIDISCVSVKATTTEKLGFCGRGEGIEAQAVCILKKNDN